MSTLVNVDSQVAKIREWGQKVEGLMLPQQQPRFYGEYQLFAIIGTGVSVQAIDVSRPVDYAQMYAHASEVGAVHTVELWTFFGNNDRN